MDSSDKPSAPSGGGEGAGPPQVSAAVAAAAAAGAPNVPEKAAPAAEAKEAPPAPPATAGAAKPPASPPRASTTPAGKPAVPPKPAAAIPTIPAKPASTTTSSSDDLHPPAFALTTAGGTTGGGMPGGLPSLDFRQKRGQVSVAPSPPKPAAATLSSATSLGGGGATGFAKKKAAPKKDGGSKPKKKKAGAAGSVEGGDKKKAKKKKPTDKGSDLKAAPSKSKKKPSKKPAGAAPAPQSHHPPGYSAQQAAVNDMMRRALEEDQYSALGSVVDTDSSDDEEEDVEDGLAGIGRRRHSGGKLDRAALRAAMRRHLRMEGAKSVRNFDASTFLTNANEDGSPEDQDAVMRNEDGEELAADGSRLGKRRSKKKKPKRGSADVSESGLSSGPDTPLSGNEEEGDEGATKGGGEAEAAIEEEAPRAEEEGSIFGQTAGASNATWVECDRCKKWRRLRGVVDARKLPSRWYCSMNTDPNRARCSAPEEEYDAQASATPESAADQRARRHLRVWVRRLHCHEAYESRQRGGKKRAAAALLAAGGEATTKEPYEWVRCCNPSCGKWRMLLRSMDASAVMEGCADGEWYCVMNTWDEKAASCGAVQENLPAVGCPPWVHRR